MRRRTVIAAYRLLIGLSLASSSGCAWLGVRGREDRIPANPRQLERIQQISERAQAALDRGEYESARVDLEHLVSEEPDSPRPSSASVPSCSTRAGTRKPSRVTATRWATTGTMSRP